MWHMPVQCIQNKHQNKRFDIHRPHFPSFSICCEVVCRAAEAPCLILTGAFPRPTCSCQWACQQTKEELAYEKEQLVSVNIQAYWTAKASVIHTYVVSETDSASDFSPFCTMRQPHCLNLIDLGPYHCHLCCHTFFQWLIKAKHRLKKACNCVLMTV